MNPMKIANIIPTIEAIKPPAIPGPIYAFVKIGIKRFKKKINLYMI